MKIKILLFALTIITFIGCKEEKKEIAKTKEYEKFFYRLPDSEYKYSVNISEISTEIVKDAFILKEDKYSPGTKEDGYSISLNITITNPYDKEMTDVPFPNDIFITSMNKENFTDNATYKKRIGEVITPKVTDENNKKVKSNNDCFGSAYCLNYKAKETKKFKLKFESPIFKNIKSLVLVGFQLENIEGEEEVKEGYGIFSEKKGYVIDVEKKKIINEHQF